jgi:hypothetical protein
MTVRFVDGVKRSQNCPLKEQIARIGMIDAASGGASALRGCVVIRPAAATNGHLNQRLTAVTCSH